MSLENELIDRAVVSAAPGPRDSWSMGTVASAPASGHASVMLDGATAAVDMALACACAQGDRVLTVLLGRSRIAVATVGGGDSCPYAVGDLYTTTSTTAPGTRWPGTTWEAYGAGRVLVGVDANQTEFDTVGETGGAKTHALATAEMPAHTHVGGAHAHYISETTQAASHSHLSGNSVPVAPNPPDAANNSATASGGEVATSSTGGGTAHNNLQPYIVVNIWRRTA